MVRLQKLVLSARCAAIVTPRSSHPRCGVGTLHGENKNVVLAAHDLRGVQAAFSHPVPQLVPIAPHAPQSSHEVPKSGASHPQSVPPNLAFREACPTGDIQHACSKRCFVLMTGHYGPGLEPHRTFPVPPTAPPATSLCQPRPLPLPSLF